MRLVPRGRRRDELHPEAARDTHERVADVVPVADVRESQAGERSEALM